MKLLMALALIPVLAESQSWPELFQEYDFLLQDAQGELIIEQHRAFAQETAPTIAHPLITCIPIIESSERLVHIDEKENDRVRMLSNPPQGKFFYSEDCNSGFPHASYVREQVYDKLSVTSAHLDELAQHFGYQPGEISIKVFEGLRDLKTQEQIFQYKYNEIKVAHPELTDEEAYQETTKWVSPVKNNVPVHSTAAAVDVRLLNIRTNEFIDMGKFGVIGGENKGAPTFSELVTPSQKRNRLYLLLAAAKAGLVNYVYEWWHFSSGDRYAAYWQEKDEERRVARYGSVE